ncbi:hypothetical protein GGR54DRAFT_642731 [Hypoxylon sp. NC1633]|nr:hypothetical protein GGR54DRAFT_642731 [Hypoxylon sp. NC1633]
MFTIKSNQLASWILYLFILAVHAQSGCNHDDCYNALFPCDSPVALAEALNYCSTVGHYGATNYPARATAACGNTNKRAYISACACDVVCPSLVIATTSTSTALDLTTLTTTPSTSTHGVSSDNTYNHIFYEHRIGSDDTHHHTFYRHRFRSNNTYHRDFN